MQKLAATLANDMKDKIRPEKRQSRSFDRPLPLKRLSPGLQLKIAEIATEAVQRHFSDEEFE